MMFTRGGGQRFLKGGWRDARPFIYSSAKTQPRAARLTQSHNAAKLTNFGT